MSNIFRALVHRIMPRLCRAIVHRENSTVGLGVVGDLKDDTLRGGRRRGKRFGERGSGETQAGCSGPAIEADWLRIGVHSH
jgi:hypothetical protein